MSDELKGKRIAVVVENGFEQVEMTQPREALEAAGATVDVISPHAEKVKGWDRTDWGDEFPVDVPLDRADPAQYQALVLPGGVMNPDKLRRNDQAVAFVRHFFDQGKPVASICHGPWTLIEAGAAKGRRMTSYHTLQTDLRNAGAEWVDQEVVEDGNLVTSRNPDDLPAFNRAIVRAFAG